MALTPYQVIFWVSLLLAPQSWGASMYELALDNLAGGQEIELEDYANKMLLVNFFEPECSWCLKQMRDLEHLSNECSAHLQPISIGVHGDKQALKRVVYRSKIDYPAGLPPKSIWPLIASFRATPVTVLTDTQGEPIFTMHGYIPYEKLRIALQDYC